MQEQVQLKENKKLRHLQLLQLANEGLARLKSQEGLLSPQHIGALEHCIEALVFKNQVMELGGALNKKVLGVSGGYPRDSQTKEAVSESTPLLEIESSNSWTEESSKVLQSLWDENVPVSQIAKMVQRSDNAVIGKLQKLKCLGNVQEVKLARFLNKHQIPVVKKEQEQWLQMCTPLGFDVNFKRQS